MPGFIESGRAWWGVFLVTFYLHKFIPSAFCARLEQWGLTASTAFSLVAEHPTPSVSFSYFPAHSFRWKASSWKALWPLLVVFSLLESNPKDLSTLVLFSYGKAKLIPCSMWYHFSAWKKYSFDQYCVKGTRTDTVGWLLLVLLKIWKPEQLKHDIHGIWGSGHSSFNGMFVDWWQHTMCHGMMIFLISALSISVIKITQK